MRPSLNKLQEIEHYLLGSSLPEDHCIMEAKLLIDKELAHNLQLQAKTYGLIRQYGRQQLRLEIEQVHRQLFTQHRYINFKRRILRLFQK